MAETKLTENFFSKPMKYVANVFRGTVTAGALFFAAHSNEAEAQQWKSPLDQQEQKTGIVSGIQSTAKTTGDVVRSLLPDPRPGDKTAADIQLYNVALAQQSYNAVYERFLNGYATQAELNRATNELKKENTRYASSQRTAENNNSIGKQVRETSTILKDTGKAVDNAKSLFGKSDKQRKDKANQDLRDRREAERIQRNAQQASIRKAQREAQIAQAELRKAQAEAKKEALAQKKQR